MPAFSDGPLRFLVEIGYSFCRLYSGSVADVVTSPGLICLWLGISGAVSSPRLPPVRRGKLLSRVVGCGAGTRILPRRGTGTAVACWDWWCIGSSTYCNDVRDVPFGSSRVSTWQITRQSFRSIYALVVSFLS